MEPQAQGVTNSRQLIDTILATPPGRMQSQHTEILYQLMCHFFGELIRQTGRDVNGTRRGGRGGDGRARRRRARSPEQQPRVSQDPPRNPWNPVMRIVNLGLSSETCEMLSALRDEPHRFLEDRHFLEHEANRFQDSPADAFLSHYNYALVLQQRRAVDGIRWLFVLLLFFDIVKEIRPDASGRRIGHLQAQEVEDFLGPVLEHAPMELAKVTENMDNWSKMGRRLNVLCERFGEGCLFYLSHVLSDNL